MQIAKFGFEPKRGFKNEESSDSDSDNSDDSENSAKRAKGLNLNLKTWHFVFCLFWIHLKMDKTKLYAKKKKKFHQRL